VEFVVTFLSANLESYF